MKKLNEQRMKRFAGFAIAVLAIIATMILFTDVTSGLGILAMTPIVVGGMTLEGKEAELYTALVGAIKTEMDKKDKDYISATKFQENVALILKEFKFDLKDNEQFKSLQTAFEKQGLELKALQERGKESEQYKSVGQQFKDYMLENKDAMQNLASGKVKEVKFSVKVAANMLASTNVTGTVPAAFREPGMVDVAREQRFIMDIIGYGPTANKTIEFVEKVNPDGTVAFVLDTEAFAQIDFDIEVNSSSAKDTGAFITVHENMISDIDFMASEIDRELIYQVKKNADSEILSGTGLTSHLKGLTVYANAGFSVTTISVKTPNIGDCVSACIRQVELVGFDTANMILMNPSDYESLIGTKDTQGRYVGHPLLSPDGTRFAGIPIDRSSFIAAGYLLVGNKLKSNIKVLQDIELAIGYNLTGEFTKRLITVRAALRLHHYIKDNHVNSFVYDSITNIKAAIIEA
jgi:HK97 family phage major capsid protein